MSETLSQESEPPRGSVPADFVAPVAVPEQAPKKRARKQGHGHEGKEAVPKRSRGLPKKKPASRAWASLTMDCPRSINRLCAFGGLCQFHGACARSCSQLFHLHLLFVQLSLSGLSCLSFCVCFFSLCYALGDGRHHSTVRQAKGVWCLSLAVLL
jgi:hypothetical protein